MVSFVPNAFTGLGLKRFPLTCKYYNNNNVYGSDSPSGYCTLLDQYATTIRNDGDKRIIFAQKP